MKGFLGRWWPLVLVIVSSLAVSIGHPRSPLTALIMPGVIAILVFAVLAVTLVVALVRKAPKPRIAVILGSLVLSGAFVALCVNGGPLWMRFMLSRAELHDAAILAVQGEPPTVPLRVGLFDAEEIVVDGGIVRIRTFDDGVTEQGLAFYPHELPDTEMGEYAYIRLGWERGQWYVYDRMGGT